MYCKYHVILLNYSYTESLSDQEEIMKKLLSCLALALVLTGCGGGGGEKAPEKVTKTCQLSAGEELLSMLSAKRQMKNQRLMLST